MRGWSGAEGKGDSQKWPGYVSGKGKSSDPVRHKPTQSCTETIHGGCANYFREEWIGQGKYRKKMALFVARFGFNPIELLVQFTIAVPEPHQQDEGHHHAHTDPLDFAPDRPRRADGSGQ